MTQPASWGRIAAGGVVSPRAALMLFGWHDDCWAMVNVRAVNTALEITTLKTSDLMTTAVATCAASQSLEEAARAMWEGDVGCLVVVDAERRPVGMITDRDIAMAAYTRGALLRDILVEWAMAKELFTCFVDAPLKEVESGMTVAQVRRVPVLDARGALAGIISIADIARSSQSSPIHLMELPGVARTLIGITERRFGEQGL